MKKNPTYPLSFEILGQATRSYSVTAGIHVQLSVLGHVKFMTYRLLTDLLLGGLARRAVQCGLDAAHLVCLGT